jgi:hypothetical protein
LQRKWICSAAVVDRGESFTIEEGCIDEKVVSDFCGACRVRNSGF